MHWFRAQVAFSVDALYFHAARQAFVRARSSLDRLHEAENVWKSLVDEEQQILEGFGGDRTAAYDKLERVAISMEGADAEIGEAYGPILKEVAAVHLFCVASLEAHVNSLAKDILAGSVAKRFLRRGLTDKWLTLPRLLNCPGFDREQQPFKGFIELIIRRDKLAHHKRATEEWVYGSVPGFVTDLGLTTGAAEASIATTEAMVTEFARQRAADPPFWLREDLSTITYFEVSFAIDADGRT